jgi:hypothetical protein
MLARVLYAFRYDMLLSLSAIAIAIVGGLAVARSRRTAPAGSTTR